ncbi:putative Peptidase M14 carboxypeptidase A domain-containing protein [Seiridium cardinale]|uniref:Peptidase M14 carboxypeptidase A domain-containing protein n=1 Tax=Seiridium cardinale TaxID=138064 RepID=A0ABR2X664_9PEZI
MTRIHRDLDARKPSGMSTTIFEAPQEKAPSVVSIATLNIDTLPKDTVLNLSLRLTHNALSEISVPILAYRSPKPGPTIGVVCAIHGNEINGIPVIQKLFQEIREGKKILQCGSIIGVLVLNIPGFLESERGQDGQDLNRLMPGKASGTAPQQYAFRVFHEIVMKFDYLVDLHTASRGRKNSLYVRADMNQPTIKQMACALQPQIIVHNSSPTGSVRGCAQSKGIHAVTIEIGDCSVFQSDLIDATFEGLCAAFSSIGVMSGEYETVSRSTHQCERSYWIFSRQAGILRVYRGLAEKLERGSIIAEIQSIFGEVLETIYAPNDYDTVVIHLGVIGNNFSTTPVDDGHL